jgi:hypothetical protein
MNLTHLLQRDSTPLNLKDAEFPDQPPALRAAKQDKPSPLAATKFQDELLGRAPENLKLSSWEAREPRAAKNLSSAPLPKSEDDGRRGRALPNNSMQKLKAHAQNGADNLTPGQTRSLPPSVKATPSSLNSENKNIQRPKVTPEPDRPAFSSKRIEQEVASSPVHEETDRTTKAKTAKKSAPENLIAPDQAPSLASHPVINILLGRLESVPPAEIPKILTGSAFVAGALAADDLNLFMQQPQPLGNILESLNIDAAKIVPEGKLSQLVSPLQALQSLGLDASRITIELDLMSKNIPLDGFSGYMERALSLQTQTGPTSVTGAPDQQTQEQGAPNASFSGTSQVVLSASELSPLAAQKHAESGAPAPGLEPNPALSALQSLSPASLRGQSGLSDQLQGISEKSMMDPLTEGPSRGHISNMEILPQQSLKIVDNRLVDGSATAQLSGPLHPDKTLVDEFSELRPEDHLFESGLVIKGLNEPGLLSSEAEGLKSLPHSQLHTLGLLEKSLESQADLSLQMTPRESDLAQKEFLSNEPGTPSLEALIESPHFEERPFSLQQKGEIKDLLATLEMRTNSRDIPKDLFGSQLGESAHEFDDEKGPGTDDFGVALGAHQKQQNPSAITFNTISGPQEVSQTDRNEMIQKILDHSAAAIKNGGGSIKLDLSTHHMGTLNIDVKLQDDKLSLKITAPSDLTRSLLVNDMPALKASLLQQNINLNNVEVAVGGGQSSAQEFSDGSQKNHHYYEEYKEQQSNDGAFVTARSSYNSQLNVPKAPLTGPVHPGRIQILA